MYIYTYDRRCKTPCKAEHVEREKLFVLVLPLVLPPCFKKQASVKICEASVKVPMKLNSYCTFPCIREAP